MKKKTCISLLLAVSLCLSASGNLFNIDSASAATAKKKTVVQTKVKATPKPVVKTTSKATTAKVTSKATATVKPAVKPSLAPSSATKPGATTTTTPGAIQAGSPPSGQPGGTPPNGTPPTGQPGGTPPNGTPPSGQPGGAPGGGNSQGATVKATAVYSLSGKTSSESGTTYAAKTANQSGVIAENSSNLTLDNITVNKTAGDTTSEDESNFYGLNAAVVSKSASTITLKNSKLNTFAEGSNGVFSTGSNSVVNVSDTSITTSKNSSRGLDATMGGTINASNVTISTAGIHCAAIATDRGNGTINVTGGSMTTAGADSPGIYSTGKISATGSVIKATGAEAAVVEGKNSITLTDVNISGEKTNGVMLYQSFSGDAEVGTASFTMTNGSLSSKVGSLFFITNTDAIATLKNVAITNATDTFITAAATQRWGTTGQNGGKLKFTADGETISGKVICDNISSINMSLVNSTSYTGSINTDNKLAKVAINLDSTSKWNITADSYVTSLTDADTTLSNIVSNGHTVYYDASNTANAWLGGKTITLADGGTVTPMK